MKIGIVSDVHCNAAGLKAALELMGAVDELVCAGDSIYQYRFSNEVVALLRESDAHVILGNHEETFYSRDGERARASAIVDRDHLDWLSRQPMTLQTHVNGKTLYVVHGSPWEPFREYLYPTSKTLLRFRDFDADFVLMGHTHQQMAQRVGRPALINPGSTGEARDAANGRRLSFAILDTAASEVSFCNFVDPTRPLISGESDSDEPVWTQAEL
jgi:putative phosphoesterase